MSEEVPVLWLVSRASGLIAYAFLTLTVVLGITAGARTLPAWWPRFLTQGLHRGASATALLLLVVHVVALVMDPFVVLTWVDVVVPFRAGYKPTWTALGTIAVDVLLLVFLTSISGVRMRLGPRVWRVIHCSAYAAWALSLMHGLGAGTDTTKPAITVAYAVSFSVVLGAVLLRAARPPARAGARLTRIGESR